MDKVAQDSLLAVMNNLQNVSETNQKFYKEIIKLYELLEDIKKEHSNYQESNLKIMTNVIDKLELLNKEILNLSKQRESSVDKTGFSMFKLFKGKKKRGRPKKESSSKEERTKAKTK